MFARRRPHCSRWGNISKVITAKCLGRSDRTSFTDKSITVPSFHHWNNCRLNASGESNARSNSW
jgi:hypothetical protein